MPRSSFTWRGGASTPPLGPEADGRDGCTAGGARPRESLGFPAPTGARVEAKAKEKEGRIGKSRSPLPPDLLSFSRGEALASLPSGPGQLPDPPSEFLASAALLRTPTRPLFGATVQGQDRRPAAWGGWVPPVPLPPYPRTPNLLPNPPRPGRQLPPTRSRPSCLEGGREGRAASRDLAPGSCALRPLPGPGPRRSLLSSAVISPKLPLQLQ